MTSCTVASSSSLLGSKFLAILAMRVCPDFLSKSSSTNFLEVTVPLVDLADDL